MQPELAGSQTDDTSLIEGIPALVIGILSPNDTQKEIDEKLDLYLEVNVPHIWIVDPHDETVLVHRPGQKPELFMTADDITSEPEMPGLRIPVGRIFS